MPERRPPKVRGVSQLTARAVVEPKARVLFAPAARKLAVHRLYVRRPLHDVSECGPGRGLLPVHRDPDDAPPREPVRPRAWRLHKAVECP